jgi:hypothetical protein
MSRTKPAGRWLIATLIASQCVILPQAFPQPAAKGEQENLVPPGGAGFDIPVHAGEVCILSFPGQQITDPAIASSNDFEVRNWGSDGVAVRANGKTPAATIALAAGKVKVNLRLRLVPTTEAALTLVRFKAASAEEAFAAAVEAELAKRMATRETALAKKEAGLDELIRDRADGLIAEKLLRRNEVLTLSSHERNNDNVIAHVQRALLLGDDAYLIFQIENRSSNVFRLARAVVSAGNRTVSGPSRLFSTAIDKDPSVIGVVPAGVSAYGVVVVRGAVDLRGKELELELADPSRRGTIRLTRGIAIK